MEDEMLDEEGEILGAEKMEKIKTLEQEPPVEESRLEQLMEEKESNDPAVSLEEGAAIQKLIDLSEDAKRKGEEIDFNSLKIEDITQDEIVIGQALQDDNFFKEIKEAAKDGLDEAKVIEQAIVEKGEGAKDFLIEKAMDGIGGKILAQIENNKALSAACLVTGLLSVLSLAKKDKGIAGWLTGLTLGGASTYMGLSLFGKTEQAKKFIENQVLSLTESGEEGDQKREVIKDVVKEGISSLIGEEELNNVLRVVAPFSADIPGLESLGKLVGKKEQTGNVENQPEEDLKQSSMEQNQFAEAGVLSGGKFSLGNLKKWIDKGKEIFSGKEEQSEENPNDENRVKSEIAEVSKEVIDFSEETNGVIQEWVEGKTEIREVIASVIENDSADVILTSSWIAIKGAAGHYVNLEAILLKKYWESARDVTNAGLEAKRFSYGQAITEYITKIPEFSLAFATKEALSNFFKSGGNPKLLKSSLVGFSKGTRWGYLVPKNLTVGVYRAGKFIADHGATAVFRKTAEQISKHKEEFAKVGRNVWPKLFERNAEKKAEEVLEKSVAKKIAKKLGLKILSAPIKMLAGPAVLGFWAWDAYDAYAFYQDYKQSKDSGKNLLIEMYGEAGKILTEEMKRQQKSSREEQSDFFGSLEEENDGNFENMDVDAMTKAVEAANERIKNELPETPLFEMPKIESQNENSEEKENDVSDVKYS